MTTATTTPASPVSSTMVRRELFGIKRKQGDAVSLCFDMIETADDILSEVGVCLVHNGASLNILNLRQTVTQAETWLAAAQAALSILDNPDWNADLEMARAGLRVVTRLRICLDYLELKSSAS